MNRDRSLRKLILRISIHDVMIIEDVFLLFTTSIIKYKKQGSLCRSLIRCRSKTKPITFFTCEKIFTMSSSVRSNRFLSVPSLGSQKKGHDCIIVTHGYNEILIMIQYNSGILQIFTWHFHIFIRTNYRNMQIECFVTSVTSTHFLNNQYLTVFDRALHLAHSLTVYKKKR